VSRAVAQGGSMSSWPSVQQQRCSFGGSGSRYVAYGGPLEYTDVIAAMFEPSPADAVSAPTAEGSPARRLRDAIEPISMHSVLRSALERGWTRLK